MNPNESTAVAATAINTPTITSTSTRRPSWKKEPEMYDVSNPFANEKRSPIPASNNPFINTYAAATMRLPATDIEAQDGMPFQPKPRRKSFSACMLLLFVILIWALFILGAIMLMNSVFPDALRFERLRELKGELLDTKAAIATLKSQVGWMYGYVEGMGLMEKFGGLVGNVSQIIGEKVGKDGMVEM